MTTTMTTTATAMGNIGSCGVDFEGEEVGEEVGVEVELDMVKESTINE